MEIILNGACGRMGAAVIEAAKKRHVEISACVDVRAGASNAGGMPFYRSLSEVKDPRGVLVDFSNHVSTADICAFARKNGLPCVIASTGHTESELAMLRSLSQTNPVFVSGNMSLGISVLIDLCRTAVKAFGGDCDVEIIEKHHRNKLDSPSGTALMIANGIKPLLPEGTEYVTDRSDRREIRPKNEIGISSVRCGEIFGEHEVLIAHTGEVLSIKHTAQDRSLFAEGALTAAEFIAGKENGWYSMRELLAEKANSQ
ncbi:MAG: 4-hydroxy-tetrahydrodipicolinate reductase [Clostridia bacterium]|nr:4-hydroxy-tetrahydrodipicolinate reductase [Clostridia bacterium]